MLESSFGLSYSSQTVCVHMYLCEFDETHIFMLWVLANNVIMHGVRCRRAPCDTSVCTLTPQKCLLTSAPIITPRCVYTSRYLFLPRPVQHHVSHVVSQSLWHCHAQWVQGVIPAERGCDYLFIYMYFVLYDGGSNSWWSPTWIMGHEPSGN